ncbi:class I SAM-dependent methyltransferase [Chryseobacterium chendengshani]|uniref:class I SAM-dependent methyltransferase n=1 Tax=Chryseobacterium sp. LJ668 TaxID=2864040 RepID=UPI001C690092|nr:class I SAM-dependent methyltransferase [Chryseobacterium sp. LJ668]MBW8521839.1 class I SAM-dependent methyltransferase [Chryseobacterium sp. LJ668]QYK17499.1 class I SAM-dependent methyltransferase [Chryseobacterium sp. LJ668]
MTKIFEIATTFFAYLKRPDLYPELRRKIWKNIFNRSSGLRGKDEAEKWCQDLAVSEKDFIENVLKTEFVSFEKIFPQDFEQAVLAQEKTPVKMGGAGSLSVIYYINEFVKSQSAIETGVAYGWSSFAALASLVKRNGTLYSSDMPYILQNQSEDFVGCVIPEKYKNNWELFRFADKESLPKIFEKTNTFDTVHYDSDKTYDGRMWAYSLLWDKLRNGGIFMSDDVGDNAAFKDYCERNGRKPHIIEFDGKYAGIIIKD